MKEIGQHIKRLILRNDYAVVPNLGGFIIRHQPAIIKDDQYLPPISTIGFSELMNVSDGLLAIEVSRNQGITFREAVAHIDKVVKQWKEELDSGSKITIGELGTLHHNDADKLEFISETDVNFLPNNYGLTALTLQRLAEEATVNVPIGGDKPVKKYRLPSHLLRYAAVGLLAFGTLFFSPTNNAGSEHQKYANLFSLQSLSSTHELDQSGIATLPKTTENKIVEKEVEIVKVATPQPHKRKDYYVIVGCFRDRKVARNYIKELKSLHFSDAEILPERSNKYRVALNAFESQNDAITYMRAIRSDYVNFADAWVLNKKND